MERSSKPLETCLEMLSESSGGLNEPQDTSGEVKRALVDISGKVK